MTQTSRSRVASGVPRITVPAAIMPTGLNRSRTNDTASCKARSFLSRSFGKVHTYSIGMNRESLFRVVLCAIIGSLENDDLSRAVIRAAGPKDADAVWAILEPVIRTAETYALPQGMTREDALAYWFSLAH